MTGHREEFSLNFVIPAVLYPAVLQEGAREPGREPGIFSNDISGTFLAQLYPRFFTKKTSQEGNNFR